MTTEIEVILEHWERYRAVTLQFLDLVPAAQLAWRPDPESFSYGDHLQHIALTEAFYHAGLFSGDWNAATMQLSAEPHDPDELRHFFLEVRAGTLKELANRSDADLATPIAVPHAPGEFPLRWWLWFILEHEIHHKAQLAVYARAMGHVPPYYALPLPKGQRPDIVAR